MKIYPTGKCFDDALDYLMAHVSKKPLWLVHGIVHFPESQVNLLPEFQHLAGKRFAHAWVEDETLVWNHGILENGVPIVYAVEKEEYYTEMQVEKVTKYTPSETLVLNEKFMTYGPWEQAYMDLCRNPVKLNLPGGVD